MRKPQGLATMIGPTMVGDRPVGPIALRGNAEETECDTYTCSHCQRIVHVPVKADPSEIGGLCKQCMGLICPVCVDKRTCTPWERTMAENEAREALINAVREI